MIGVLAVALLTTGAFAGDETDKTTVHGCKFDKLDKGSRLARYSKAEAKSDSTLTAEFASVDQDADGYVTRD